MPLFDPLSENEVNKIKQLNEAVRNDMKNADYDADDDSDDAEKAVERAKAFYDGKMHVLADPITYRVVATEFRDVLIRANMWSKRYESQYRTIMLKPSDRCDKPARRNTNRL